MISVFARLLSGDAAVVSIFASAKGFWVDFFHEHGTCSQEELARLLSNAQTRFYRQVAPEDYAFAKEIMALTAIGTLYEETDGFDENEGLARRLISAFRESSVSVEVKGRLLDAAVAAYRL